MLTICAYLLVVDCPPIVSDSAPPEFLTANNFHDLRLSNYSRTHGTSVTLLGCYNDFIMDGTDQRQFICIDGTWEPEGFPKCQAASGTCKL